MNFKRIKLSGISLFFGLFLTLMMPNPVMGIEVDPTLRCGQLERAGAFVAYLLNGITFGRDYYMAPGFRGAELFLMRELRGDLQNCREAFENSSSNDWTCFLRGFEGPNGSAPNETVTRYLPMLQRSRHLNRTNVFVSLGRRVRSEFGNHSTPDRLRNPDWRAPRIGTPWENDRAERTGALNRYLQFLGGFFDGDCNRALNRNQSAGRAALPIPRLDTPYLTLAFSGLEIASNLPLPRLSSNLVPQDPLSSGAGCPTCHQPGATVTLGAAQIQDAFSAQDTFGVLYALTERQALASSGSPAQIQGLPRIAVTALIIGGALALENPRLAAQGLRTAGVRLAPGIGALLDSPAPSFPPSFRTPENATGQDIANALVRMHHQGALPSVQDPAHVGSTQLSAEACRLLRDAAIHGFRLFCGENTFGGTGGRALGCGASLWSTLNSTWTPNEDEFAGNVLGLFECRR